MEGECRRGSAGTSAVAEMASRARAGDAELFHLRLESGPFHPQPGRRALRAAQHPPGLAEDAQDVVPFGVGQGPGAAAGSGLCAGAGCKSPRGTWSDGPGERMTARSMTFCSSRMLPGQG